MVGFFQANNANYGPRTTVSVGASPFVFTNLLAVPINLLVSGGTVSILEYSIDGVTFDVMGMTLGQVHLNPGQMCRVTYLTAPTVVYYPI